MLSPPGRLGLTVQVVAGPPAKVALREVPRLTSLVAVKGLVYVILVIGVIFVTSITILLFVLPKRLLADIRYLVLAWDIVGVPVISQVIGSILNPFGKEGLEVQAVGIPPSKVPTPRPVFTGNPIAKINGELV
jgi:hypothetical protein